MQRGRATNNSHQPATTATHHFTVQTHRRSERSESKNDTQVMSVNSSSSPNASHPSSSLSPNVNIYFFLYGCCTSTIGAFTFTAFTIISVLILLPLCFFVLYLGHQRWRQQRSSMTMSHADLFTYHMAFAELLSMFGCALICWGVHADLPQMIIVGLLISSVNISGQVFFHALTCVERYLAVVHPVTYLSLRKAKWIRIRIITIGCVWLLCFLFACLMFVADNDSDIIIFFLFLAFTLLVVSFCSLSVLRVLIRPGPGDGGGDRQRVDQSKLRAFYTIMAILGVLLVRVMGHTLAMSVYAEPHTGETAKCVIWLSTFWFSLPSSLVLPLLFLQRAGKLLCCKNNNEPGQGSD